MGKRGFLRREASPKEVLEHRLRLAREVAPPTPKGQRGRPWRYDHGPYLAPLLFRAFSHLPYRETEALLQDLMEAPFPSHGSLARHAARHLDLKLLEALLDRLSRELVRGHGRLLALVRWERERRWLLPWGGVAGRGYAPDPRLGGKAGEEAREGWDPEVCRGPTFGSGSLGRPWCGRFWSSSPTALGSFSPFCRRPLGTRRFTRQARPSLTAGQRKG
jgi:hypothetical protein